MPVSAARRLGRMFGEISKAINAEKDRLTALDGAIGDADHGITMSLGFNAVTIELAGKDIDASSAADIVMTAATVFLNAVGASTGPLYASGFLKIAQVLRQDDTLSTACQVAIVAAMAAGIRERGKGERGDKTMLDTWMPAAEAAADGARCGLSGSDLWARVIEAAERGANATGSMVAARGRAARLGERALGHIDPGAASAVIILRAMAATFANEQDAGEMPPTLGDDILHR